MAAPVSGRSNFQPVRLGLWTGEAQGRRRYLAKISLFALIVSVSLVATLVFAAGEKEHLDFWLSQIGFAALLLYLLMFEWPSDPLTPLVPVIFIFLVTFYGRSLLLYYGYRSELTNSVVTENIDLLDRAMV